MSNLIARTPSPAEVLRCLPEAFPSLFGTDEPDQLGKRLFNRCMYGPDGPSYWPFALLLAAPSQTAVGLYARQHAWWDIAGVLIEELDQRGWSWTIGTGNSAVAYCAIVDQPKLHRSRTRFSKCATAWADLRGLALCAAACEAVLGREIWATASPS